MLGIKGLGMKLRKQCYDLLPRDLEQFPVWEFALDEEGEENQDEATVRPCTVDKPVDPTAGMLIVRAMFTFADGTLAYGYLTPPVKGETSLGIVQPVIVTAHGQVMFWCGGTPPLPDQLAANYRLLARDAGRVFPLAFESVVLVSGGAVRGLLSGFLVLADWKTGTTRTVR